MGFKTIKNNLRSMFKTTLGKISIVLIFPFMCFIIYAVSTSFYYINNYKNLLISSYTNELNSFLINTEEQMNSIISTSIFISQTSDINSLLTSTEPSANLSDISYVLNNAKNSSTLIDSIALYNKAGNYVVTSSSVYSPDDYFSDLYAYEKYPLDYWYNFNAPAKSTKILPASNVINNLDVKKHAIVPIVFTPFDINTNKNIIIFNISVDNLFSYFEECNLTPNSEFYMIDNFSGEIYTNSTNLLPGVEHRKAMRALNKSLRVNSEIISENGKEYLSIKSTKRSNVWGYTYHVLVPEADINTNVSTIVLTSILSIIIMIFVLALFVLFGRKTLYAPWKRLANTMTLHKSTSNTTDKRPSDIANYIMTEISSIATTNEALKQNLTVTLPLSQEKYLIDILNNNGETNSQLLEQLAFKYDYFMSVAVSIDINPQYFTSNSSSEPGHLYKKTYQVIKQLFSDEFTTYELPSMGNILYFILNLEPETAYEYIQSIAEKANDLFETDKENISIYFGLGNIYQGFEGLKITHQEALANLLNEMNSDKIHIFQLQNQNSPFNSTKESVLINYLIAGYTDKASELINNVLTQASSLSYNAKKQVYSDIIFAFEKVFRQKNIRLKQAPSEILETLSNDTELLAYIKNLLETIAKDMKTPSTKLDISAVIDYISTHYTEEIYLDNLAKMYNTSMKYLSRRISQHLNMPFKDYITKLRIDKAKELLETSEISITELFKATGFQNRAAFLRAFKLRLGITPSEYRKLHGHLNK